MRISYPSYLSSIAILTIFLPFAVESSFADEDEFFELEQFEYGEVEGEGILEYEGAFDFGAGGPGFRFQFQGEREDGEEEQNEVQLLYGWDAFDDWEARIGILADFAIDEDGEWLTLAVAGEIIDDLETTLSLFANEENSYFRVDLEHEWEFAESWSIGSFAELNINRENNTGEKEVLSHMELGVNLVWKVDLAIQPYIGFRFEKNELEAQGEGESGEDETWAVVGFKAEF